MKRITVWFLWGFAGLLCFSGGAGAEFYKYIDENGKVRFTDNLANVPEGQRQNAYEYEESPAVPVPEDTEPDVGLEEDSDTAAPAEKDTPGKAGEKGTPLDPLGQRLKEEGERLSEEYEGLMEEKTVLDKAASQRLTPAARRALEKRIKDFNARIRAYDKKRVDFDQAVEDYTVSGQ